MIKEYFKEKVGNMRALGGFEIQGKKVEYMNIIRSNVPINLDENDIEYLKKLGIKNIIDLRTQKEWSTKISCFEGRVDFKLYHISLPGGDKIPNCVADVPKSYISMLDAKEEMNTIFNILINGEGILYFCNAGKDRTGVISMLILIALGASDESICTDYLKTNDYLNDIIRINNFSEDIINIITPKREYVEEFVRLFKKKYGSIEEYLKVINIDCKKLSIIGANYLRYVDESKKI